MFGCILQKLEKAGRKVRLLKHCLLEVVKHTELLVDMQYIS